MFLARCRLAGGSMAVVQIRKRTVTRTKKLFLAAALVAVGFGVASFLGSPNAAYLSHRAAKDPRAVSNDVRDRINGGAGGAGPAQNQSARLVPEVSAGFENPPTATEDFADPDGMTPLLLTTNAEAIRTIVPIRDDSGALSGWYGANTDIDDLKQAQMKLDEVLR